MNKVDINNQTNSGGKERKQISQQNTFYAYKNLGCTKQLKLDSGISSFIWNLGNKHFIPDLHITCKYHIKFIIKLEVMFGMR